MTHPLAIEGSDKRMSAVTDMLGQMDGDADDTSAIMRQVVKEELAQPPAPAPDGGDRERNERGQFVPAAPAPAAKAQPVNGAPPDAPVPGMLGDTLQLNYRGRTVTLPIDRVRDLAMKGFDYDQKMATLNQEKAKAQQETEGFKAYNEWRQFMIQNKEVSTVVFNVLNHFEQTGQVPQFENGRVIAGAAPAAALPSSLEQRLNRIESMVNPLFTERREDAFATLVNGAIQSRPILKRMSDQARASRKPDLVAQKLGELLQNDPGADVNVLADSVATEWRAVTETLSGASYADDKVRDTQTFVRSNPDGTPPSDPKPVPSFKGKDLKSGAVRSAVMNMMRAIDT